jgi:hypothetical protein
MGRDGGGKGWIELKEVNSVSEFLILLDCFKYFVLDDSVLVVQMIIQTSNTNIKKTSIQILQSSSMATHFSNNLHTLPWAPA